MIGASRCDALVPVRKDPNQRGRNDRRRAIPDKNRGSPRMRPVFHHRAHLDTAPDGRGIALRCPRPNQRGRNLLTTDVRSLPRIGGTARMRPYRSPLLPFWQPRPFRHEQTDAFRVYATRWRKPSGPSERRSSQTRRRIGRVTANFTAKTESRTYATNLPAVFSLNLSPERNIIGSSNGTSKILNKCPETGSSNG